MIGQLTGVAHLLGIAARPGAAKSRPSVASRGRASEPSDRFAHLRGLEPPALADRSAEIQKDWARAFEIAGQARKAASGHGWAAALRKAAGSK
jgi:hypothetical protein